MSALAERQQAEFQLEKLLKGKRLTPAHRRIVQIMASRGAEVGFMSSIELAKLANVSQPSMTRFAAALGFDGFLDMRRYFRTLSEPESSPEALGHTNKYQAAIEAEATNVAALAASFSDLEKITTIGKMLAESKPLVVLGLRASSGPAHQFSYFAAKIHSDIRTITDGGSLLEDTLEQAHLAGGTCVLAFALPLYPHETINGLRYANRLGLKTVVIADSTFQYQGEIAGQILTTYISSSLVFDSSASASVLMSILLDAMCDAMPEQAAKRLDYCDRSSSQRKVFVR